MCTKSSVVIMSSIFSSTVCVIYVYINYYLMYTSIQTCTYMSTASGGLSNNYLETLNEAIVNILSMAPRMVYFSMIYLLWSIIVEASTTFRPVDYGP